MFSRGVLPLLVALLAAASSAAWAAHDSAEPSSTQWTGPVELSAGLGSSWFPDVAADPSGRVHIVWTSGFNLDSEDKFDAVYYTTSAAGGSWIDPIDIASIPHIAGSETTRPAILCDAEGTFHLTYRAPTRVYYSHVRIRDIPFVERWERPRLVSGRQIAYYSDIARGPGGRLHVVYTENLFDERYKDCTTIGCYHLYHRYSDDGGTTWFGATDISNDPSGTGKPQLVAGEDGTVHVAWVKGRGGGYGNLAGDTDVMYARSGDGGHTWGEPVNLMPGGHGQNVALVQRNADQLVAVWERSGDKSAVFSLSNDDGRTWSAPAAIEGVRTSSGTWHDSYTMATDAGGNVHLVLSGLPRNRQPRRLLHLWWDGSSWSAPISIASYAGDVPEWPRLAVGAGNVLHLVWFVRDEENVWKSNLGRYKVFYSRGTAAAPAVARAEVPPPDLSRVSERPAGAKLYKPPLGTGRPRRRELLTSSFLRPTEQVLFLSSMIAGIILTAAIDLAARLLRRRD